MLYSTCDHSKHGYHCEASFLFWYSYSIFLGNIWWWVKFTSIVLSKICTKCNFYIRDCAWELRVMFQILCSLASSSLLQYLVSDVSRKKRVALAKNNIPPDQLLGLSLVYIKRISSKIVYLKCAVTLRKWNFLNALKYPARAPEYPHYISMDDILTLVESVTRSGCLYPLTK